MLTGWGHQTAWIGRRAAAALLLVVGFARVSRCPCVHGELEGVYGHHRDIGPELARLESTILEARKMKNLAGRNNLPPELVPVFDTHRRSFKGSPQRRPTAEFLL